MTVSDLRKHWSPCQFAEVVGMVTDGVQTFTDAKKRRIAAALLSD
jgi:hypothetical protein